MSVPSCNDSVCSALLHGTSPLQLLPRMLTLRDILCYLLNSLPTSLEGARVRMKPVLALCKTGSFSRDNSAAGEHKPPWLGPEGTQPLLLQRFLTAVSSCCGTGPPFGSAFQRGKCEGSCVCPRAWTAASTMGPPPCYRSGCRTANPLLLMTIRTDVT